MSYAPVQPAASSMTLIRGVAHYPQFEHRRYWKQQNPPPESFQPHYLPVARLPSQDDLIAVQALCTVHRNLRALWRSSESAHWESWGRIGRNDHDARNSDTQVFRARSESFARGIADMS
jgi:hypothetical protein